MTTLFDLLTHSFIAKGQCKFLNQLKNKLKRGELVLICDFSENYSFLLQNEVQGFHWINVQATIHPIIVHFKDYQNLLQREYYRNALLMRLSQYSCLKKVH